MDLTILALLTREDATHRAMRGPVPRSWSIKLALAYLFSSGKADREGCEAFWREMSRAYRDLESEARGNTRRHSAMTPVINGFYNAAKVERTVEMMSLGASGRRHQPRV